MITVRFPTGVAVRYNNASFLRRGAESWMLYTADPDKGGAWVASIQLTAGAIVEALGACAIENPAEQLTGTRALKEVVEHLEEYGRSAPTLLVELKQKLRAFNATTRSWRRA